MKAAPTPERDDRRIFSISEINRLSRSALESQFRDIWIVGEVSNLSRPQSGHLYFSLKDEKSQISAALFRGKGRNLRFGLEDGMLVEARGTISIYSASGRYQIICNQLKQAGKGSLQEQFEKLKKKLESEGLFAPGRKRKLPLLPQHVGVVTSSSGAAIRDILNVARRRFPNLHILIAPVMVQGEDAARQIAHAIDHLNRRGGLDALIIGRGGGSIEDLWAFNEELVARAVARSEIPVISGVGHETDFTISDFVADLRAPTPSAAAELLVGQKDDFVDGLQEIDKRLRQALGNHYAELRNRLSVAAGSYVFREPGNLMRMHRQRLSGLLGSMNHSALTAVREAQQRIDQSGIRARHAIERRRDKSRSVLARIESQLAALDPKRVLRRGYSISRDAHGKVLRTVADISENQTMNTQLANGVVVSQVSKTQEEKDERKEE